MRAGRLLGRWDATERCCYCSCCVHHCLLLVGDAAVTRAIAVASYLAPPSPISVQPSAHPSVHLQVGLLAPAGPFSLLDLFPLTQQCGEECTIDGIHSVPEVYDAALQLLLNIAAAPAAPREKGRAGRL